MTLPHPLTTVCERLQVSEDTVRDWARKGTVTLRSFGGWLYREAGYSDAYVQSLYQHRSADLTKYYTESGYAARYMDAEAGL